MSNGDSHLRHERATADRAISGRDSGRVDPVIDRMVERGIRPFSGPDTTGTPRGGSPAPPLAVIPQSIEGAVRSRQRFLSDLTPHLQEAARRTLLSSPEVSGSRDELNRLEQDFRHLMEQQPQPLRQRPSELRASDRSRALAILDDAYEAGGHGYDTARPLIWRSLYNQPDARRLMTDAQRMGLIQLSDRDIAIGNAPAIIDFDNQGRHHFRTVINIDHAIPRERVPFYALRPTNLHPQTARFNQVWLNRFSSATPFPMGTYGQADDIEDFVQANQLSRRQRPGRPISRRRRRSGSASRIASRVSTLVAIIFSLERLHASAQIASEMRATLRRRTELNRGIRPIRPTDIALNNVISVVNRIFDRNPLEVDSNRANEVRRAVENWLVRDYRRGGSGNWHWFESRYEEAVRNNDTDLLGVTLMTSVIDDEPRINSALAALQHLLVHRDTYIRRADAAQELSELQGDILQDDVEGLSMTFEDFVTIVDYSQDVANSYRRYVNYLTAIHGALEEVHRVNREQYRRLEAAIARAYERRQ